jgi:hypothetical protein
LDIVVVILTVVVGRRKKRSIGDIWTFSWSGWEVDYCRVWRSEELVRHFWIW